MLHLDVILGLSDNREDEQSYSSVSKAELPPILLDREAYPLSSCTAKETSTGKQIINNITSL